MKGGEFWPIVKCVKIRVAQAEALKTGVVLVDLPGIRDSNAARDNAAKEYLKNCNAVWVVASITRAVDDKTAKEILNSNLRRQLFMDGLYGNLAFVCTKTDSFNISDIVRDLDLREEIQPLEEELEELEGQRMQAEEEKGTLHMALHLEQRPGVEAADPAWLQKQHDFLEKEFRLSALQKQKEAKLRAIGLICVQARNRFSKQRIRMDFNTGLEVGAWLEIPALKDFVIETGLKTSMKATEKVIRDVARVISQIVHYLTNQRAEDVSHQAQVRETVQQALQGLPSLLQEAADDVLPDIQYFFGVLIQTSLSKGANKAKELSEDIVKSWGLPGSGLPHSTYHAACLRRGVYTSLKCGCVDFNSQLAKPVNDAIAGAWVAIFGSKLEESLERFTKAVLDKLKFFFRELKRDVGRQNSLTEALDALHRQQMEAIQAQLRNFLLDQEFYISRKQRSISRMLTPAIQADMDPAYAACSQMSGPGYFQRMKDMMESYIRENKDSIFEAAAQKLQEQLSRLQQRIRGSFQSLVLELSKSLRMQFEPLLKPVQKNAELIPDLMNICAKVDKICKRSCVVYVLPSTSQVEAGSPEAERELQGNPLCLSALHLDIRLGALPLSCIVAIQVSGQDLALRLTDESAVALPLGSVSLCESCLPLGCLILHLSAEAAGEIRRRCRVRASSPGQHGREALVILDKDPDQTFFSRLTAGVSSSRRDASWVQTLSLCQGRERLESLGVYSTPRQAAYKAEPLLEVPAAASVPPRWPQVVSVVQQPPLPPLNLLPYGRKRAGEAGPVVSVVQQPPLPPLNLLPYGRKRAGEAGPALLLLEKRHKSQAGADHAGHPLSSWSTEDQLAPCGGRAASCPLPASGGCFPEDCRQKMAASESFSRPGSTGAPVRVEEGLRGKRCDPNPRGDREKNTQPVESGEEASPAGGSWLIR
ncbi:PREDICTED: uncharacterized protein LOC107124820 [Gekko japonicus]|uniref:Uncharacterized protein LOC107124820 n=1 Tax=Gekko japonicus TaxID=146911 RepID=A0ABM1LCX8_GEKJA|nr:PREDICTED: uncharacterized protein LOC107124820 [Gekko japonicus]